MNIITEYKLRTNSWHVSWLHYRIITRPDMHTIYELMRVQIYWRNTKVWLKTSRSRPPHPCVSRGVSVAPQNPSEEGNARMPVMEYIKSYINRLEQSRYAERWVYQGQCDKNVIYRSWMDVNPKGGQKYFRDPSRRKRSSWHRSRVPRVKARCLSWQVIQRCFLWINKYIM